MRVKHQNNGKCEKCKEIIDKYPDFNKHLRGWFVMFQAKHPEAHVSCAGRGLDEQEAAKAAGASKASYGKSAHNYNCALDLFVMLPGKDLYDKKWFNEILEPEIPYFIRWYGEKGSAFFELPHIEFRDWRALVAQSQVALVEPIPTKKDDVA